MEPVSAEEWFHIPSSMAEWEEMRLEFWHGERRVSGENITKTTNTIRDVWTERRHIMIRVMGHRAFRRVAINVGAGFVPGTNAVVMGAAIGGGKLGWEMVGIRDGFEGLLHPDRYPDGGLVTLSPQLIENLDPATGGILGQAPKVDPFHVRATEMKKKSTCPMSC